MATLATQLQRMKTLPIERMFVFDSTPCDDCRASGQYALAARCYSCNGLGRRFTVDVRSVIREVMAMLHIDPAALDSHGRWWPNMANTIGAAAVTAGMRVRLIRGGSATDAPLFDVVTRIEDLTSWTRRFHFEGGTIAVASSTASFERELSDFEKDRADVFMSQFVGRGVVEL